MVYTGRVNGRDGEYSYREELGQLQQRNDDDDDELI